MKLKGKKKLVAQMDKFLRPFGVKSCLGVDFCYYYAEELVQFTVVMTEHADHVFYKFISEEFNYYPFDMFLFSLLHEIGHHNTLDYFDAEEITQSDAVKRDIEATINDDNFDEKCMEYFYCPIEYIATEWAVNYMRRHEKELRKEWKKMLKHFRHFYKVNGVVAD